MKLPSAKRLPAILTGTVCLDNIYILSSYLTENKTTSRLVLSREIVADYSENSTERILALRGQDARFLTPKQVVIQFNFVLSF